MVIVKRSYEDAFEHEVQYLSEHYRSILDEISKLLIYNAADAISLAIHTTLKQAIECIEEYGECAKGAAPSCTIFLYRSLDEQQMVYPIIKYTVGSEYGQSFEVKDNYKMAKYLMESSPELAISNWIRNYIYEQSTKPLEPITPKRIFYDVWKGLIIYEDPDSFLNNVKNITDKLLNEYLNKIGCTLQSTEIKDIYKANNNGIYEITYNIKCPSLLDPTKQILLKMDVGVYKLYSMGEVYIAISSYGHVTE